MIDWKILPRFDEIKTGNIEPGVRIVLARCEKKFNELEEANPTSWEELMDPLEMIEDDLSRHWGLVSHLHHVKNSPELRDVYNKLLGDVIKFTNKLNQSQNLYKAYLNLQKSDEFKNFNDAQKRILKSTIHEAELNGVGLNSEERKEYNQISQKLAELTTRFSNNILDAIKAFKITITSPEQIIGLPTTLLELTADTAKQEGHSKATPTGGPWVLTLDSPCFIPFMQHSKSRQLRKKLYEAYISKASDGEWDNSLIANEIINLRQAKAKLLGFKNFADLSLSRKMAKTPSKVQKLLYELRDSSRTVAEEELKSIQTLADKNNFGKLKHWDIPYWAERLREKQYEINDEELRPFFPLPHVLAGLFELSEKLFGVKIKENIERMSFWNKDVKLFRVFDLNNQHLASFYLDPYSRPEEKQGGAWMDSLVGRSIILGSDKGKVRLPVAYMICNQSKPVGGKPSLMTFREVETLFHEFGHCLQHMLTTIDQGMASGISNVEWDAVEIASQFMENWCYDRGTLRKLGKHFETNQPIPESFIDKLLKARTYREGTNTLRQVNFGLLDLEIHQTQLSETSETILDIQRRIDRETLILPPQESDRFYCSFSHIFSGGYAAGYYSYKWSEVLSADAFAAFEEIGLDNEDEIKQLGHKFRETFLSLGGSQEPLKVFVAFRGREPNTKALMRHTGLISQLPNGEA